MDRRNGGDPLAPPRPPKLLPRVHRPRAAEPPMMSAPPTPVQHQHQQQQQQQQQLCTNNHSSSRNNNNNNNHTNNSSSSSNNSSNNRLNNTIASSRNSNNNSSSNTAHLTTPLLQLHHHQQQQLLQQQHPHTAVSLNRNNSNLSSASSTSSVSTTVSSVNSFTRRRPPPPPLAAVTSSAPTSSPILPLLGASLNLNLLNNNININSIEPVPVSPVTLAAPRPESERLTNEYVDTPFRTAQQLQQASRNQHPAGQHIHGQTTTQHNLLLLQQSQRQQQQHNQQQQQQHHSSHHQSSGSHSNVVGTCVVSAATAASIHSNSRSLKGDATGGTGTTPGFGAPHATSTTPTSATLATSPPTITRLQQHHRPNALPITQPITKQPASTTTFKKDLSESMFHEEPLDLHHIGGVGASAGSMGSGSMGSPIGGIILGDGAINPITCPRCERCRCEQCQSPRQLPQTWVCNKTCLCSAETIIDYASCLCCVKALFYHCARDQDMECDDGNSTLCVDDPCSCLPNKRAQRWGWLGALSLVLPCLWCYWPMRGCVAICEKCYARHAGHGCRCQAIGSTSSMLPIVNIGRSGTGGTNATIGGTKSSGISGGVHSGISGSGNGHHHHHHHHHGGGGGGGGGNTGGGDLSAARILRKCDITPEKRLLDSSPEY